MDKDRAVKEMLDTKRQEIVWALSLQNYTHNDIAYMFRGMDRSTVTRMINKRPLNYKVKWVKSNNV